MKVAVIDYGMGNLFSVRRALEVAGASGVEVTADPDRLAGFDRVVLPGVGAFADGMAGLHRAGFVTAIRDYVAMGRPMLGICLGMQMLMDASEEFGQTEGLGLIPGTVRAILRERPDGGRRKLPAIGWYPLRPSDPGAWRNSVLGDTAPGSPVYFLHSFQAEPVNPAHLLALYDLDRLPITAAIRRDNVTGTQFHPEKSGPTGLAMLSRFLAG